MKVVTSEGTAGTSTTLSLQSGTTGDLYLVGCETDPSETPALSGWSALSVTSSTSKLSLLSIIRGGSTPATAITGTTDHRVLVQIKATVNTFDASAPFDYNTATQESGTTLTVNLPESQTGDTLIVVVATGEDIATTVPRIFNCLLDDPYPGEGLRRSADVSATTGNGGRIALFKGAAMRDRPERAVTVNLGANVPAVAFAIVVRKAVETLPVLARHFVSTIKPLQTSSVAIDVAQFAIPASSARVVEISFEAKLRQYATIHRTTGTRSVAYSGAGTTGSFNVDDTDSSNRNFQGYVYVLAWRGVTNVQGFDLIDSHTTGGGLTLKLFRKHRVVGDSTSYSIDRTSGVAGRVVWFTVRDGFHDPDDVTVYLSNLDTLAGANITYSFPEPDDGEPRSVVVGFFSDASCTSGLTADETVYVPSDDTYTTAISNDTLSASGNHAFISTTAPLMFPFTSILRTTQSNAHSGAGFIIGLKRAPSDSLAYWADDETAAERGSIALRTTVPADTTFSAGGSNVDLTQNRRTCYQTRGTYASASKRTATIQITTPTFTAAPVEIRGSITVRGVNPVTYYPQIGAIGVSESLPYISLTFAAPPTVSAGAIGVYEIGDDTPHTTIANASTDGRVTVVGNELRIALDGPLSTDPMGYYVHVADTVVSIYDGTYRVNGIDSRTNWYFTPRAVRQRVTNNLLVKQ